MTIGTWLPYTLFQYLETFVYLQKLALNRFEVKFLPDAFDFLDDLDPKSRTKLLYIIDRAKAINDPKIFKKLNEEIWEFRSKFLGQQIRLLAFWDKTDSSDTLVIATHGFIKKSKKTPLRELSKAEILRQLYFSMKKSN